MHFIPALALFLHIQSKASKDKLHQLDCFAYSNSLSPVLLMAPAVDQPGMSAREAAAINAAAVTRNYTVKPRLQYQTVSAVSGNHINPFKTFGLTWQVH